MPESGQRREGSRPHEERRRHQSGRLSASRRSAVVGRRHSLRRHATVVVGLAGVLLVLTAALATAGLLAARHGRDQLLVRIDPAIQQSDALERSLIDEETGVRGYALAQASDFLQPYRDGVVTEGTARAALAVDLAGQPALLSDLRSVDRAVASWRQQSAAPLIAATTAHIRPSEADLALAKTRFDGVRAAFGHLNVGLGQVRRQAQNSFDQAFWVLVGVVVGTLLLVTALLTVVAVALRRRVIDPLRAVGSDSRQVADGDLDHEVRQSGPAEIAELAEVIEDMRARVVRDLYAIEAARRELEDRTDDLARSNRDLEQFAYVASHDLQEPLRKVASFCQLLEDRYGDQLDERATQYIGFAVDGARRMQALVADLLTFSRVGRTTDRWVEVDCRQALDNALANLGHMVTAEGAVVRVGSPLPTIRGDAVLITALWQNLIGNAIKFRGAAPPTVEITCETDGEQWLFRVADNGIGIEPQYAERVFVIFQRLHPRDRYEGTGIGLALCRKIVEFHRGHIDLDPEATGGTTIRFTLPLADHAADSAGNAGKAADNAGNAGNATDPPLTANPVHL